MNHGINNSGKKSSNISIRCTPKTEERVKNKARQTGLSLNAFVLNCIESGLARKTKFDKYRARELVEAQEAMNRLVLSLGPGQEAVKRQLINDTEGAMGIWDS